MTERQQAARGDGGRLREDLLAAAERIATAGAHADAITVRAVAAEAGVSPPAVYLHFASRDDLVFELALRHFGAHSAKLENQVAQVESPLERIALRGRGYLDYALAHPLLFHAFFMGDGRQRTPDRFEGFDDITDTGVGAIVADVRAAVDAGLIEPTDPLTAGLALWFGVHGLASLLIGVPQFPWPSPDELADRLEAFQFASLRPRRG